MDTWARGHLGTWARVSTGYMLAVSDGSGILTFKSTSSTGRERWTEVGLGLILFRITYSNSRMVNGEIDIFYDNLKNIWI